MLDDGTKVDVKSSEARGELTPRGVPRILISVVLAFWDRPRAVVPTGPERSAWVADKDFGLAAAEAVLKAVRPYIKNLHSSNYIEQLANGEICLALGWSGDVLQAKTRAVDAKNGVEIDYRIPKEGAVMFFDQLAIPKDAKHPKNAHLFINYLLRPEIAARNSNYISFANANKAATPLVDASVTGNPNVYPPAELMAKLVPDMPESPEFSRSLNRAWTSIKTGK